MTSNGHAHVHLPWTHPHHPPSEKRLLDGVDLASPLHSGYMFKEAHSHLVFHKRFFVLFPRVLVYYEKESYYKKDVARGTLEHRHKAVGLEGLYLSKPEKKPKGAKFSFILHAPDKSNGRHDFLLVADSKEECKRWIEVLQHQNPSLVCDPSHHHTKLIHPDTPPQAARKEHTHSEEAASGQSSVVGASVTSADVEVHSQHDTTHLGVSGRPGSPRHGLHRLISSEGSIQSDPDHLHLDIQYLNIAEGHSDIEDS